jgi:hypothetical protein
MTLFSVICSSKLSASQRAGHCNNRYFLHVCSSPLPGYRLNEGWMPGSQTGRQEGFLLITMPHIVACTRKRSVSLQGGSEKKVNQKKCGTCLAGRHPAASCASSLTGIFAQRWSCLRFDHEEGSCSLKTNHFSSTSDSGIKYGLLITLDNMKSGMP